jgi:hypothetical protein
MASRSESFNRFDVRVEERWQTRSGRTITISNTSKVHGRFVVFVPNIREAEVESTCL